MSDLAERVAALETEVAALRAMAESAKPPRKVSLRDAPEPCTTCRTYGEYRCYDAPLECPKFYRWVMAYKEAKP